MGLMGLMGVMGLIGLGRSVGLVGFVGPASGQGGRMSERGASSVLLLIRNPHSRHLSSGEPTRLSRFSRQCVATKVLIVDQ